MDTLLIIGIVLVFSAFFSGIEIAFVSANKLKIEVDKSNHVFSARLLSRFAKMPSKFIIFVLLGNNITLVVYGIFAAKLLDPWIDSWLPEALNIPSIQLIIQTLIATFVVLVFAEFLPKTLFRANSNKVLSAFSIPITLIYVLLYPIVYLFMWLSNALLRRFFKQKTEAQKITFSPIDIDYYIQEFSNVPKEENEIRQEIQMVQNVMDLQHAKVRECMVPRKEIVAVDVNSSLSELQQKFTETGLSKILIYKNSVDDIIGYIHAFDLFKNPKTIRDILRKIEVVPESMLSSKLMKEMIDKKRSITVVVDEFGGTSGIITLEDLMEEIFGEIEDEFDVRDSAERKIDDKHYVFSARSEIDHLNQEFDLNLPESDEYETLAGLIMNYHESIPQNGEEIHINDKFVFRILQASGAKIEKVMLTIIED
ncbi:MAG: hemolysin family protein [Bacteroidales bacterium]|jgi:CBS domain containing-hemolysin-like protein|nr:hemolysin family protein [Bacteroidales bacterium]